MNRSIPKILLIVLLIASIVPTSCSTVPVDYDIVFPSDKVNRIDITISAQDWQNMLDEYPTSGGCNWDPVTVNAVAHLCASVGSYVDMDYGCDGSSAYTEDMEAVYEMMGYSEHAHNRH